MLKDESFSSYSPRDIDDVFLVFQGVLVFLPWRVDTEMRRETAQLFVYLLK